MYIWWVCRWVYTITITISIIYNIMILDDHWIWYNIWWLHWHTWLNNAENIEKSVGLGVSFGVHFHHWKGAASRVARGHSNRMQMGNHPGFLPQLYQPGWPALWKSYLLTIVSYYWLVVYQPLWKIWVRQLGLLFPWKNKSCPKPPTRLAYYQYLHRKWRLHPSFCEFRKPAFGMMSLPPHERDDEEHRGDDAETTNL